MAGETITMTKLKQIFLLRSNGVPYQQICTTVTASRNTVRKYIRLASQKGLSLAYLSTLEDQELAKLFAEPAQATKGRYDQLKGLFPWIEKELRRTGVTRWLLWGEYKSRYPDGYSYAQFCEYYKQWSETQDATMHFEHEAGDKLFIDFTGKKLPIIDEDTGEIVETEVFVALLGHSQLTYVEALPSQKKEDFVKATENALHYFGGVPKVIITDNLKSAVTRADKYEPDLNETYLDFANHYGAALMPTRSYKPKDKALVENAVSIVYKRVFAPMRNQEFFSIEQLNFVMRDLLEKHNSMAFQKEPLSRRKKFDKQEREHLNPLPKERYQVKHYKTAKVMKNCHVQLEKSYYSVPYRFIGTQVKIMYTQSHVNIFSGGDRVALHERAHKKFTYTTDPRHLPSTHRFVSQWNPTKFLNWAERIGPNVKAYIEQILEQKTYPEQAYKSCVGILSFEKKVGKERLVKAIDRAIYFQVYNYKAIKKIIEGGLDTLVEPKGQTAQQELPFHKNIRGKSNYK